jgi:hypothetical protein
MDATQEIGPWLVTFKWPDGATQGGPRSIEIGPRPGATEEELAGGLSSTVLRKVDFTAAADQWRAGQQPHLDVARVDVAGLRRAAKEGLTPTYLSHLAAAYVTLVDQGDPRVTATLAEMVGKRPETIRAHLKQSRSLNLLTSIKGKAGGQITDRAKALLAKA